jgi:hypothetical protein
VIAFRRAVQAWDDAAALQAAAVLVGEGVATSDWIDGDELRDGALVAALRTGRPELVAQWDLLTAKLARRGVNDLRSRLLAGWVAAASAANTLP